MEIKRWLWQLWLPCSSHAIYGINKRFSHTFFFGSAFAFAVRVPLLRRDYLWRAIPVGPQGTLSLTSSLSFSPSLSLSFTEVSSSLVGNLERSSFGLPGCLFAASRNAKCSSFTEVSTWRSLQLRFRFRFGFSFSFRFGAFPRPRQATALQQRPRQSSWHLRII